jgi:phosphatidate cytidylyltransferase
MTDATRQPLFDFEHAFDHAATIGITAATGIALVGAPIVILALAKIGRINHDQRAELLKRWGSWVVLAVVTMGSILLGGAWMIGAIGILGLLCYREFARATGLFRDRLVNLTVAVGIIAFTLSIAVADDALPQLLALPALTVGTIAAVAILPDQPRGYLQRVALGSLGFLLFGVCLGHLAYFAHTPICRPIVMFILLCVALNDVFAYLCGKTFGRRKLAPRTSPHKTIGGAIGALLLTTALVASLGHLVFRGTALEAAAMLIPLGVLISLAGQLGDLVVSSIKRDLGIKDLGMALPGHGGLLDRFDSLLLAAPVTFHFIGYFLPAGVGLTSATGGIAGGPGG